MNILRSSRLAFASAGLALTLALVPSAGATPVQTTIGVSATVQATCLVSAAALGFGTYTGAVMNSTSTITVTCSNTTPYNLELDPGLTSGATVTTRQMAGPAAAGLNYALYSDSARSLNWGQTDGTDTVAGVGSGSAQTITVYGQVPAGQYIQPGSYTDTITATISY